MGGSLTVDPLPECQAARTGPPCLVHAPWSPGALTLPSHRRTFLQAVSSEKVRATNLNCSVVADVRHDGSEPCVDVLFGDGYRLIMRSANLTAQEMFTALASHIRARNAAAASAAANADKPGPVNGTRR
ncbi:39S ribosomal protein L53, mitochondrial [Cricetulus griseus]|uniref:Large ribosomal subunit protein mL53 n=1 Tax=Cricetulus griseus TaxID=10029 RepID=G3I7V5_CRIGR|nr:39S ribosomal protein L53, mitochondrial [Cricetulus griseus]